MSEQKEFTMVVRVGLTDAFGASYVQDSKPLVLQTTDNGQTWLPMAAGGYVAQHAESVPTLGLETALGYVLRKCQAPPSVLETFRNPSRQQLELQLSEAHRRIAELEDAISKRLAIALDFPCDQLGEPRVQGVNAEELAWRAGLAIAKLRRRTVHVTLKPYVEGKPKTLDRIDSEGRKIGDYLIGPAVISNVVRIVPEDDRIDVFFTSGIGYRVPLDMIQSMELDLPAV